MVFKSVYFVTPDIFNISKKTRTNFCRFLVKATGEITKELAKAASTHICGFLKAAGDLCRILRKIVNPDMDSKQLDIDMGGH
jgi:hypothetical protein